MKEVLKLALEALTKTYIEGYNLPGEAIREAITAIKAALAQDETSSSRTAHEPVACVEYIPCCTDQTCPKCKAAIKPELVCVCGAVWEGKELIYTPPQRQPLVIDSQKKAIEYIEKTLWEVIDVAAMFPEAKPDPRTWEHLMVYKPMVYKPQPQEAAPRKPLTDEEIKQEFEKWAKANCLQGLEPYGDSYHNAHTRNRWQGWLAAYRAIEAAHGIKEKNT